MTNQEATPRTLAEAHQSLASFWPGSGAQPAAMAKYYRQAAKIYAATAEVDTARPNETKWWADESNRLAEKYEAQAKAMLSA